MEMDNEWKILLNDRNISITQLNFKDKGRCKREILNCFVRNLHRNKLNEQLLLSFPHFCL
jgi:hypothetical protein